MGLLVMLAFHRLTALLHWLWTTVNVLLYAHITPVTTVCISYASLSLKKPNASNCHMHGDYFKGLIFIFGPNSLQVYVHVQNNQTALTDNNYNNVSILLRYSTYKHQWFRNITNSNNCYGQIRLLGFIFVLKGLLINLGLFSPVFLNFDGDMTHLFWS